MWKVKLFLLLAGSYSVCFMIYWRHGVYLSKTLMQGGPSLGGKAHSGRTRLGTNLVDSSDRVANLSGERADHGDKAHLGDRHLVGLDGEAGIRSRDKHGGQVKHGNKSSEVQIHVLVLRYMGQQGVGVKALAALQCWTGHIGLPVAIVEPVMSGSVMTGDIAGMAMSDLFDLDHFNNFSEHIRYPKLIPKGKFFEQSSKKIIFVTIGRESETNIPEDNSTEACHTPPPSSILNLLSEKGYCVVKMVSVSNKELTAQTFHDVLGRWLNSSITVVFSKFGPWLSSINGVKCIGINDNYTNAQYQPSVKVLTAAKHYKEFYLDSIHPIAIMLRTEHVLHRKHNLTKCFQDVVSVTRKLQGSGTRKIPMVALDFGKYGSNTWQWYVADDEARVAGKRLAEETLQVLLRNKMSFQAWEETFAIATGNITNAGYVAAVQRAIASRAHCLVLMGGGDFQELILRDYLQFHAGKENLCVHLVCTDNERTLLNLIHSK